LSDIKAIIITLEGLTVALNAQWFVIF